MTSQGARLGCRGLDLGASWALDRGAAATAPLDTVNAFVYGAVRPVRDGPGSVRREED